MREKDATWIAAPAGGVLATGWRAACVLAALVGPLAAGAMPVPLPTDGVTLNIGAQLQTQVLANENGDASGSRWSTDVFARRTRLLVNGEIGRSLSYLLQLDNANFGKFGNYTGRAIVQDAWIGWTPTGSAGHDVVFIDAGILLIPISRHLLESTTNFITADVHTDSFRLTGSPFPGLRETGVQARGWLLDKRVGFRGGVYEGTRALTAPGADRRSIPQVAGFLNVDVLGSEEGSWLYGTYKWGTEPILSVSMSGLYQSRAIKSALSPSTPGSFADQKMASAGLYLDWPVPRASELVLEAVGYSSRNGAGSADTGVGFFADLGFRRRWIAPYVSYEYFRADDCPAGLTSEQCSPGRPGQAHAADSRNAKVGLNVFFNKNLNHLNLELGFNHGQSAYGPQSLTTGNAGYTPAGITTLLATPTQRSLLLHWNVVL